MPKRLPNRIWTVVLAALLLVGVVVLWPGTAANMQENDIVPIVQAARGYMQFEGCLDVIPQKLFDTGTVTWTTVKSMYDERLALLNSFAMPDGPLYGQLSDGLQAAFPVTDASYSPHVYERSVDFHIDSINVCGDQATVHVQHTDSWVIPNGDGNREHTCSSSNGIISKLTLRKDVLGKWLIVQDDWEFMPGKGP